MIWNQIQFEESSEVAEGQAIEPEKAEPTVVVEPVIVEEVKTPEPVIEPKVTKKPKQVKPTSEPVIEPEPVQEKQVKKEVNQPNLELENRVLKKSIETGFDAEILSALVAANLAVDESGSDNLDSLVSDYVAKYPSLAKVKPKDTSTIAPTNVATRETREAEQRNMYFGQGNNSFFNGQGVREN